MKTKLSKDAKKSLAKMGDISAEVRMDDVVNIFISKYETSLIERKAELIKKVTGAKKEFDEVKSSVQSEMSELLKNHFDTLISWRDPNFINKLVVFKFESNKPQINHSLNKGFCKGILYLCRDKESERYDSLSYSKELEIPEDLFGKIKEKENNLNSIQEELNQVLESLRNMSAKERQVRGTLSAKRLEASGHVNILEDKDILGLISIEGN